MASRPPPCPLAPCGLPLARSPSLMSVNLEGCGTFTADTSSDKRRASVNMNHVNGRQQKWQPCNPLPDPSLRFLSNLFPFFLPTGSRFSVSSLKLFVSSVLQLCGATHLIFQWVTNSLLVFFHEHLWEVQEVDPSDDLWMHANVQNKTCNSWERICLTKGKGTRTKNKNNEKKSDDLALKPSGLRHQRNLINNSGWPLIL